MTRSSSRSRSVGVLSIAVVASVVFMLFQDDEPTARPGSGDAVSSARPTGQPDVLPTVEAKPVALDLPTAPEAPALETTPEPQQSLPSSLPHVARDGFPNRLFVDSSVFEEKYDQASLEDLIVAKIHLWDDVGRETMEDLNEFFEAGGGVEEVTERVLLAPGDPLPQVPPTPEHEKGLIPGKYSEALPDGRLLLTKGVLPWEEFTSLYNQQDELFWLIGELRSRERAIAASYK